MIIVATTSLPAVDCPNADCWNAARSCQKRFQVNNVQVVLQAIWRTVFSSDSFGIVGLVDLVVCRLSVYFVISRSLIWFVNNDRNKADNDNLSGTNISYDIIL